jgi:hypothetical protein
MMRLPISNKSVKWTATLSHVREVSLSGIANLAFWKERLRREHLIPVESGGQARVLIVSADSRFMGLRFQEVSFSVLVTWQGSRNGQDAAYLVNAFNSRRLFAFCERVFFSTPYSHGQVRMSSSLPASLQIVKDGQVVFRAEMEADSWPGREPLRRGDDCWEGPIFLPLLRYREGDQGSLFFARLAGRTQRYPFLSFRDSVTIRPSPDCEVLQALADSRFVATEWIIREDATHAKSKTYQRSELFAG